jgi:hypothetical protein
MCTRETNIDSICNVHFCRYVAYPTLCCKNKVHFCRCDMFLELQCFGIHCPVWLAELQKRQLLKLCIKLQELKNGGNTIIDMNVLTEISGFL